MIFFEVSLDIKICISTPNIHLIWVIPNVKKVHVALSDQLPPIIGESKGIASTHDAQKYDIPILFPVQVYLVQVKQKCDHVNDMHTGSWLMDYSPISFPFEFDQVLHHLGLKHVNLISVSKKVHQISIEVKFIHLRQNI